MSSSSTTARFGCAALTLACVMGAAAACGGHAAKKKKSTPTPTPVVSTSATPTKSLVPAPKPLAINPFTGGKPSGHSVVAVKIEDTGQGRPQLGIDKADIVYIEQVEGGLTRLLAIYNTTLPTVEAVRSTRANDPELAIQFGPIAYVASGGSRAELKPLDRSKLRSDINDRGGPGFARDGNRAIPNNLRANLSVIAAKLKGPGAKDIGLTFSTALRNASTVDTAIRTQVGGTPVGFNWNAAAHRYVRLIDGSVQHTADGKVIATPNVVVQFCKSTVYPADRDVLGNPAQYTHTVGAGRVSVYRNGRRINGTWTRSSLADGTHLKAAGGKPIALAPGGVWFVLVATGAPLH